MAEEHSTTAHRRAISKKYSDKNAARPENEIVYPVEKQCALCREVKPAAAFSKQRVMKDGLRPRCKVCIAREHSAKQDAKGRSRRISAPLMQRLGVEMPVPPIEDTPEGPIMRVPLTQGAFAIIDAADWPLVKHANWQLSYPGYATTNANPQLGTARTFMHRVILNDDAAPEVDHKDRNPLNNRRNNLRSASASHNQVNKTKLNRPATSVFKGVRLLPSGRWNARIALHKQQYELGCFDTEQQAADAYDAAARVLHGEFAVLNSKS